jgi:hypothetical protein
MPQRKEDSVRISGVTRTPERCSASANAAAPQTSTSAARRSNPDLVHHVEERVGGAAPAAGREQRLEHQPHVAVLDPVEVADGVDVRGVRHQPRTGRQWDDGLLGYAEVAVGLDAQRPAAHGGHADDQLAALAFLPGGVGVLRERRDARQVRPVGAGAEPGQHLGRGQPAHERQAVRLGEIGEVLFEPGVVSSGRCHDRMLPDIADSLAANVPSDSRQ